MKLFSTLFLFTFLSFSGALNAQIQFESNFENGRLDTVFQNGSNYQLWPISNLHFRITNAIGTSPKFDIYDSTNYRLRPYHYMVYKYNQDTNWHFFDTAWKSNSLYTFHNLNTFTKDTVYVAYWFPYTQSDLQDYLLKNALNPFLLNAGSKTVSIQNRTIYGWEVSDTTVADCYKKNVVFTARQHPIENINGWFIEGISDYLLSSDSLASRLRKKYRFLFYPLLNPDGVYLGHNTNVLGQGLNREWEDSLKLGGTPEIDSIRPIIYNESKGKVDFAIDLHGNYGSNIKYYWWGYNNSSPVSSRQILTASKYVASVDSIDQQRNGTSLFQSNIQGNGVNSSKTAANWFRRTFNAIAFTFEPTSEPLGFNGNNQIMIDRMKSAGASLAQAFVNVYDTLEPLEFSLKYSADSATMTPAGGMPPYSFHWSGPIIDSSRVLYNLPSGTYTARLLDANNCQLSKQFTIQSTVGLQILEEGLPLLRAYPNPCEKFLFVSSNQNLKEISIYNKAGHLVISTQDLIIDVSDLEEGIYLLIARDERNRAYLKKWIKF